MERTGRPTPQFVERAWSVSVTALITIFVYHQLSWSSSIFGDRDDRKSDTSVCRKGVKCFSNSFTYDCCFSSFVRIFTKNLKGRWQEKRELNMSKRREVLQKQLFLRLLYSIICQDIHRIFWKEIAGKANIQYVETAWSVSVTALHTIVVYHHLSGSSPNILKGDSRKSEHSICRNGVKCFSNGFIDKCCISSFVRIFVEFLKWRWQEKRHLKLSLRREVFQ